MMMTSCVRSAGRLDFKGVDTLWARLRLLRTLVRPLPCTLAPPCTSERRPTAWGCAVGCVVGM